LYDVTTLYFEAEHEDELRKVGYSKERRVDPQIVVGLLVDRAGFPLEIGCFEGNKAETRTLVPIIEQFQARHRIADTAVVAAAGTRALHRGLPADQGPRRPGRPLPLARGRLRRRSTHRHDHPRHGNTRGRDTSHRAEPVWDQHEHPEHWRAIWQYSRKRAVRDTRTLTQQENRARAVIEGEQQAKSTRFVKTTSAGRSLDQASLARARSLVGLKGYVTNIPEPVMGAGEVIASYHDLWQVEQSFRMSKSDLRARPVFHHSREAIEAHL